MSDIALLVAEEYERRTKNFKKEGTIEDPKFNMLSGWLLLLKEKIEVQKKKLVQCVWEPKTQIAIAASNSFFSA